SLVSTCSIMRRVAEYGGEPVPVFGGAAKDRCRRKAGLPQVLAERSEQIRERDGHLGAVPRAQDPTERAALLDVRGRPEQDQAVDQSRKGRGALHGSWRLTLRLAEAEVLRAVVEGHLQRPAMRVGLRHEAGPTA